MIRGCVLAFEIDEFLILLFDFKFKGGGALCGLISVRAHRSRIKEHRVRLITIVLGVFFVDGYRLRSIYFQMVVSRSPLCQPPRNMPSLSTSTTIVRDNKSGLVEVYMSGNSVCDIAPLTRF